MEEKFVVMKDIPENETVVLDVPLGKLRVGGVVHPHGEGLMVFSISDEEKEIGSRAGHARRDREAVKIVIQTPERAETIAMAFIEMAKNMRAMLENEEEKEEVDEDDGELECACECEFCPYEMCGEKDEEV